MKVRYMARLRTSENTKEILLKLKDRSRLLPNILARIAINLSIIQEEPIDTNIEYDSGGLEFHSEILFGEYEILFKALMTQRNEQFLTDKDFFPVYTKAHLERGARLLNSEYEFAGNFETFIINLLDNKVGTKNDLS